MYVVDQSKQCAQIYLQKNACCLKLQLLILFFVKSIISDMHHRITYMYINFQQNQVCRSVKTVHTNLFAQYIYRKWYKLATTNSIGNLKKKIKCFLVKRTHFQQNWVCKSIKPCTQIYLHNIASCIDLQLPIVILK